MSVKQAQYLCTCVYAYFSFSLGHLFPCMHVCASEDVSKYLYVHFSLSLSHVCMCVCVCVFMSL